MVMVSVFIPTYLDQNDKYLRAAVDSVLKQDYPVEVIVVSDRKSHPKFLDSRVTVIQLQKRLRFSAKNNLAATHAHPHSKYFLLLNDDTYMARGCLSSMVKAAEVGNDNCMVGAVSNCDNGPLFRTHLEVPLLGGGSLTLPSQFTYDEAEPWLDSLFEFKPFPRQFMFETKRLFFYNVLIPKSVWNRIGKMEEGFQNSCEDFDYCIRAHKIGVKLFVEQSAFCFHFSGKTSGVTATALERIEDQKFIEYKHGPDYLRVV